MSHDEQRRGTMTNSHEPCCNRFRSVSGEQNFLRSILALPAQTRRRLLQCGAFGLPGFSLPEFLAAETLLPNGKQPAAKRVIVLLEQGGVSHMDTWDPKPEAVAEHRSPFAPISTSVSGMQFTSLLPHTSGIAHHLAVVRSMHHEKAGADAHPNGTQYALSGIHPSSIVEMPDIGSVVSRLMGTDNPSLPPYVMVPGNSEQAAETRTGFLPRSLSVFKTGGSDLSRPDWRVGELMARSDNSGKRLLARQNLLSVLD
ncbi:MAG: DUF1501 domain-containing protein, partial [Planctomyces sp.]